MRKKISTILFVLAMFPAAASLVFINDLFWWTVSAGSSLILIIFGLLLEERNSPPR